MEYEFLLVVDGVSVDDDRVVADITGIFDGLLSWNRGLHRLAVSSEGADAMEALQRFLRKVTAAIPALRILRLDPDLVGISDIAERTGHSRQNVQQWVTGERNAGRPFPPPEGTAGRSLVWRWADVNGWLKPLGLDDQAMRPTREECALLDVALMEWNKRLERGQQLPSERRSGGLHHSPEMHRNLIARVPSVTGRDLSEWFRILEFGPHFLRVSERADWLSDEHGLSRGYAEAIVHEYEVKGSRSIRFSK
jgi:hypothetical protein